MSKRRDQIAALYEEYKICNTLIIGKDGFATIINFIDELEHENEILKRGFDGDYDLDAWLDFAKDKAELLARIGELELKLQSAMLDTDSDLVFKERLSV